MSIFDDAKSDWAGQLDVGDFSRSARANGKDTTVVLTKDFSLLPFEVGAVGTYTFAAYGKADDLAGIKTGDEIQIANNNGDLETFGIEGVHEGEIGDITLLVTRK